MRYSFIPILQLPGLFHVMGSARKTVQKMKLTQSGALHVLLLRWPRPFQLPIASLGVDAYFGLRHHHMEDNVFSDPFF